MQRAARRLIAAPLVATLLVLLGHFGDAQTLPLKTFTTADGLATSVIHFSMRDSDGFLWFAGRGGLSRFDGREFVSFKLDDQSAPLVHAVVESRDRRRFWIATDNGLYRAERSAGTSAEPTDEKLSGQVRRLDAKRVSDVSLSSLAEEPDGTLIGGSEEVVECGDPNADTLEFTKVPLRGGQRLRVRDSRIDSQGSVWIASDYGLLRRLPSKKWVFYSIPFPSGLGNPSGELTLDRSGYIWMPASTGVFVLRPEEPAALANLPDQNEMSPRIVEHKLDDEHGSFELPKTPGEMIQLTPRIVSQQTGAGSGVTGAPWSTIQASDGRIWFASDDRVYVVDGETYSSLRDSSLRPGAGHALSEDLAGNLWFGSFSGVYKLAIGGMTSYGQTSGLAEPDVHNILEMPDGRLLIAHGKWNISELTESGFETSRFSLPSNALLGWTSFPAVVDTKGSLWVLENFGLYEFKSRPRLAEQVGQTPIKHDTRSPYRGFNDSHGRLWLSGTTTETPLPIMSYDPATGSWIDYSTHEDYPGNRLVASFAEDREGAIWMGFYGGGMVKFANGKFTSLSPEYPVPKGSIFGMLFDKRGRLWISSTEEGIVRIDHPLAEKENLIIKRIDETDGLSSNNIRSLVEAKDGNIYAGTVRGVTKIDADTDAIQVFTTADGLAADFVQTAYCDRNGVMWFGTSNGLSRYEPVKKEATPGREVFISSLQIAGTDYRLSQFGQRVVDGLDLQSSDNDVRISFTSVGESTKFQYKVEGANEQDWTEPSSERTLNFANLSAGSYRLLVRTVGSLEQAPASVSFTIRPPFWRSWWFLVLAFLFVGGSVFALDRYRVSKTRQVKSALAKSVESESRFRTLAQTASDAIITIEEDSTIVYVNEAVERVFGYPPDEIVGKKLTDLMPERMRRAHDAGLARYVQTSTKNIGWNGVTLPGLRKDGTEVPLELSFGEFELDGKRYFTGIARDITARLEAEEALRSAREERMRELQKVRSRIATDLHDDIGSSLTQIAVLSEVARGQANELHADGVTTPLERIKTVSKELVAVMSDIVWAINPQKDYLTDLVQRMRRFGADVLSGRGITFEFSAPEMEDAFELGANIRREVFAIFKETVNNAAKYSQCKSFVTVFALNGEMLTLRVADDGVGFDTAVVLSDDFRPEMGGNGLVSIRRRAVELGGTCDITSTPGQGTSIVLSIPLHSHRNDG